MPTAFPRRAKHAWLHREPHPGHSAPTPVAVPVRPRPRRASSNSPKRRQDSCLAPMGSALPSRKSLLESPADFVTRAPNFQKLGQAGRARQDLVRESESTTKYGDNGEESCGGCVSIGHPFEIRKASSAAAAGFSPDNTVACPEWGADPGLELTASGRPDSSVVSRPVTGLSRNGGPFRPILRETRRKAAVFA
jgi:hypothetical protein